MDFRQLQYISTVAEYKSFTNAAKALYISQPSLSHFVSKVEQEMGARLFDRSTNPLTLTYAGEQYLQFAQQILRLNDELTKEFRDITTNQKGRLRVGMPRDRAAYMLPIVLPLYKKAYPGIEVQLYEGNTESLLAAVSSGKTDFAILPHHFTDKYLDSVTIYEEELLLVAAHGQIDQRNLSIGTSKMVEVDTLRERPFILLRRGHSIRNSIDLFFNSHHIQPKIAMETSSNIIAYRMAASGLALAIVPHLTVSMVKTEQAHDVFSLGPVPLTWEVRAVFRKDAYISKAEQAFFDIAREAMEQRN